MGVTTAVATTLRVTTQAIWSGVAESAPCICGSATLTIVTVSAYSMVHTDTVTRIMAFVMELGAVSAGSASGPGTPSVSEEVFILGPI